MKLLRYIIINGAFFACVVLALFLKLSPQWVVNITLFYTWLSILAAWFSASLIFVIDVFEHESNYKKIKKEHRTVSAETDLMFDFLIAATMAAGGYFITALFYIVGFIFLYGALADDE